VESRLAVFEEVRFTRDCNAAVISGLSESSIINGSTTVSPYRDRDSWHLLSATRKLSAVRHNQAGHSTMIRSFQVFANPELPSLESRPRNPLGHDTLISLVALCSSGYLTDPSVRVSDLTRRFDLRLPKREAVAMCSLDPRPERYLPETTSQILDLLFHDEIR